MNEEEIKIKMVDGVGTSLASEEFFVFVLFFTCLLTCGRRSLVSGTQNDIAVSCITL